MARLQRPWRQRSSASDSILRCREEEWPACSSRHGSDLPRPILFFVAAKKNGSACSSRRGSNLPYPILFSVAAKENGPPATAVTATMSASDSNFRSGKGEWPACSGRDGYDVRVRFYSSLPQRRMARLQQSSRLRPSASDPNFRCRKGEWPACSNRCGSVLPRPILISVATKENGSACRTPLPHRCIDS